ncbi:CAAX prenyl protease 1 homolog [Trichogramma pretiosum]|uniref:CAAX prenyl protease 1 homolog n=1 Tax=Trichogramma pretiosum TaxID=7493 RepID=UPI0006C98290|nr:CAAX prenyl protease 1 homolog [Trichogramma pretiosum]
MASKNELPAGEIVSPVDEYVREHIVSGIVTISLVIFLWELYLTFRQRKLVQSLVEPPKVLDGVLPKETYDKSRTYSLDKSTFSIIAGIYSITLNTAFLVFWGPLLSWEYGRKLTESCGLDPNNEIYVTAGCQTVKMIIFTILCDLPISIYETFVIEEKHKFNKQTAGFFIKDQLTKLIVSYVLIVPLICGIVWIIKNGGDYFILYLWIFTVVMSLVLMVIYPEFIAPLFDKYTALPEGDLKVRIEALASSLGFPLYKLYVVEGSRRSSHSNAYLYGFYKYKRIVLFDTLVYEYQKKKADEEREKARASGKEEVEEKEIPGCETDEIIAVLAHELGHWHHSHALKGFLYGQVIFLVNFVLFAQLLHYSPMYEGLGFTDSKPVFIGLLIVLNNILAPVNKLLSWAMTINSRKFEFEADRYALGLGHAEPLKQALIKLHKDNLGYPLYDKLYSNWHHSHPPLLERLDALKKKVD